MRTLRMKTILLFSIMLAVLFVACTAHEVVSSSQSFSSSSSSVSVESSVSASVSEVPSSSVEQSSSSESAAVSSEQIQSSQSENRVVVTRTDSIDEFIDTIDRGWYGGVYVKEDVYHILALSQYYDALAEKAKKEYDGQVVVDHPGEAVIYSLDQLETARTVLNQLGEKMGIVGLSNWMNLESSPVTNGLGVDISETVQLTDQLKEEILSQIEVKNIRFSSGSESNPNTTATSELTFHEETVTDIYAFELSTYTTVLLSETFSTEALMELLEEMPEDTVRTAETERAFIVFTETGRHYIYLNEEDTPETLWDLWEEIVSSEEKGRHIQWLTHMTPEKITEIRAGGLGKTLTEREDLEAAAEFLKKEVFVGQIEKIFASDGEDNPNMLGGLYHIIITFDTGVTYSMIGYGDVDGHIDEGGSYLSIWTSDLDKTVYYTLTEGCAAEIRKFFGQWK